MPTRKTKLKRKIKKRTFLDAVLKGQEKGMKIYEYPLKRKLKAKMDKVRVEGKEFTMKDLGEFHIQRRGFPTILKIGRVFGEGQSGGRYVTEIAHEVENQFTKKMGQEKYQKEMDKIITKIEKG